MKKHWATILVAFAIVGITVVSYGKAYKEFEKFTIKQAEEKHIFNEYIQERINEVEEINEKLKEKVKDLSEELEIKTKSIRELEEMKEIWDSLEFDRFKATSYAPFDGIDGMDNDGDPTSTSTGSYPCKGTFAVNPKTIPYYSKMLIIGKDWFEHGEALDTGGAMRQNPKQVDIFKDCHAEAMQFGRQGVTIVYKPSN